MGGKRKPLDVKFWSKVDHHGPELHLHDPLSTAVGNCWQWTGAKTSQGYGLVTHEGKQINAHRVSLQLHGIRLGKNTDHLCRNRLCVRPGHLEPVTIAENTARGSGKAATALRSGTCIRGHKLSGSNLSPALLHGRVYRTCKTCKREFARIHRSKIRDSQLNIQELNALGRDTK